ncbi:MAG: TetR/AcrR family transcriptional regulator [Spirochaetaceae bacterium]|jgi:AcrR family transcriptional regulator|nr:TetR/AcrR family transcriptional regulator [Spirochaetaceae bacterium]
MRKKNTTTEILKDYMAQGLFILMRKKPFAAISIGEIAEKAGVNRSTYYRNFNSKDDIIKYFYNKITFEHLERVKDKKDITMQDYLQKMFAHFYQYKKRTIINIQKQFVPFNFGCS